MKRARAAYARAYYLKNKAKLDAYQLAWRQRNAEHLKEKRKTWASQNRRFVGTPPNNRAGLPDLRYGRRKGVFRQDKKAYMAVYDRLPERKARGKAIRDAKGAKPRPGWTRELRTQLIQDQHNKCAICQSPFVVAPQQDHNRTTGKARGLLCGLCNRLIGNARDSTSTLRAAIAYLEKYAA